MSRNGAGPTIAPLTPLTDAGHPTTVPTAGRSGDDATVAAAVASFLTAAADHWAAVRTGADVTADPLLREYADAVSAEADATVALALALADRAPGHEIAWARRIRRTTVAARRAAGRRAGIPTLPAVLVAARAGLWAAAGWPVGGAAAVLPPRAREVAA